MRSNTKASNYKLIKEIRIKFRKFFIFYKNRFPSCTEKDLSNEFKRQATFDVILSKLNKKSRDFLLNLCMKDQNVNAKYKLNKVLGRKSHLFHVVFPSIWPFLTSMGAFFFLSYLLFVVNDVENAVKHLFFAFLFLGWSVHHWFRAIIDEATFKGHHTLVVRRGLIYGFWLFIASEIMLFFGLFWAFFHCSISPAIQVGFLIPAAGIQNVPYLGVPLFNTSLLLCSSLSVTLAHKGIIRGSFRVVLDGLFITIFLGLTFLFLQINEYKSCMYNISDGAYPSIFYMLTGLHGSHVFVGLVWLIISLFRIIKRHFTTRHYAGFLFAIWYWHFVDIIWIGVYCSIYIWLANSVLIYHLFVGFCIFIILFYFTNW